jgi:hypothetical protein
VSHARYSLHILTHLPPIYVRRQDKKEKERKGFWKKNKKETKESVAAEAKGERALSAEEHKVNTDAHQRWFQVHPSPLHPLPRQKYKRVKTSEEKAEG